MLSSKTRHRYAAVGASFFVLLVASGCTEKTEKKGASDQRSVQERKALPGTPPEKLPVVMAGDRALLSLNGTVETTYGRLYEKKSTNYTGMVPAVDALLKRARYLGTVSDYEKALAVSTLLVEKQPRIPTHSLLQARALAAVHRFDEALVALEAAGKKGVGKRAVDQVRATIDEARGDFESAKSFRTQWAKRQPNTGNLGAHAINLAGFGQFELADKRFNQAIRAYRNTYPFPVAWVLFHQGQMWERNGQKARARKLYEQAYGIFPQYAHLVSHMAALAAEREEYAKAIELLQPIIKQSDDPQYRGQLGGYLKKSGKEKEGQALIDEAKLGYGELLKKFPKAFADHAAEFFMGAGEDPAQALSLAKANLENRKSTRAYELLLDAHNAAKSPSAEVCALADKAAKRERPSAYLLFAAARAYRNCDRDGDADKLLKQAQ